MIFLRKLQAGGWPAMLALLASTSAVVAQETTPIVLDTIIIRGGYEEARGDFEGYLAGLTASATKFGTPLLEIPQSISVIGRDEIESRTSSRLSEVLRFAPGVTVEIGAGTKLTA